MSTTRSRFTANLLVGTLPVSVLVAGGDDRASAEVYDLGSGTWVPVGSMAFQRDLHGGTTLSDGRVLVTGGVGLLDTNIFDFINAAELYDPATRAWSTVGPLGTPRCSHSATPLNNGKVLVAGGFSREQDVIASAELYTPFSITVVQDPHLEVTLAETQGRPVSFDFHGEAGKTYCMISDSCLQLNVLMFGVTSGTQILQDSRDHSVEPFFDGTWMSGFGVSYLNPFGEQKNITIMLDQARDRAREFPKGTRPSEGSLCW
ncbi:hypothetical protein KFL_003270020 [Klebsormidium nitens]|uniref:Uncharacterized protein n=1 Tax=Klebsormidium nitens TaxID=105231 RepID=A0A1Y1I7T7_KLENI|nr:hypothetical protein KFL_003270020 [Klebsormidium nitens]|eukprot:GAQ87034.1 hypothetical protein KFL_003270020 [Klebsormidium nitens]